MPVTPLRSPLARAVVPVFGGIVFFAVLALATWGIASFISRGGAERTERLFSPTYTAGGVEGLSEQIDEDGPILFPGLDTRSAKRNIVVNHTGDDPALGWEVYFAYPADRDARCPVRQERGTATFFDCEERRLGIGDLEPAAGVLPIVDDRVTLTIDLRPAIAAG